MRDALGVKRRQRTVSQRARILAGARRSAARRRGTRR